MTVEQGIGEAKDQFPIGMRVLAVDDDPTCLKLLETLLRRCQYHVTTTSQAISALKMLRENKNKFDLVISDVHMPDMDGFKLLELVGLEMDLPVIMLSANSDPKLVMKGITHGACDYLLKPVRMEELKNIWQHVIRRKKLDNKDRNNFDSQDRLPHGNGEATAEQKLNKKRKDQNEDEDDDRDENGRENEDPTTMKKPRVVWSVELHRKFVAAVNQLGIDKAVPKKILDLMNVEKLTRENVASHLQKYRLYLKRISTVANQQASMVAALGSSDAPYLQMGSGLGFHNIAGNGHFQNAAFRSIPPSGMLSRLNSPAGLGMRGLPSPPGVIPLGQLQSAGHLTNSHSQFQQVVHPGNDINVLQGMPTSLELDQIQSNKGVTHIRELPSGINDATSFSVSNGFLDTKIMVGSSNSSLLSVPNKPLMLDATAPGHQDSQKIGKQSSLAVPSLDSGFASHFPDPGRCNDNWSSAVQSNGIQSNSFALNDCFRQAAPHPSNIRDSMSTTALLGGNNMPDVSSISTLPIYLQESKTDIQSPLSSIRNNTGMINNASQGWDDQRQDASCLSNAACSSMNPTIPNHVSGNLIDQSLAQNNAIFNRTTSFNSTRQTNLIDTSLMKHNEAESLSMETIMRSNEGYFMAPQKPQNSYISNKFGSLEDLASVMVKQEQDKVTITEGEFGCGAYSLRTCM